MDIYHFTLHLCQYRQRVLGGLVPSVFLLKLTAVRFAQYPLLFNRTIHRICCRPAHSIKSLDPAVRLYYHRGDNLCVPTFPRRFSIVIMKTGYGRFIWMMLSGTFFPHPMFTQMPGEFPINVRQPPHLRFITADRYNRRTV